ncbi:beta-1,6-N-acetylglucosaminyltransferase [Lachnospiraceae bacterium C1.1]|nr:beta-1,6-N-acetylglucosaminyltransferase [Lachnospiraceae bacterium C1.1]
MKKIAWLISAYTEERTLAALVDALSSDEADIYIHIDRRVDDRPFKAAVGKKDNVFFLEGSSRIKVYWGGYTQIGMQYALIKAAINSGREYESLSYITGTDYPLYSNEHIIAELTDGKARIKGFDITTEESTVGGVESQKDRLLYYHYQDFPYKIMWVPFNKLRIPRFSEFKKIDFDFYMGSEYWSLPMACIRDLMDEWEKNDLLRKYLKFVFAPSEIWIHTLFFNSKWKKIGEIYPGTEFPAIANLSPLTYFEYGRTIRVFGLEDYDKLMASGCLFARKILVGKSDELIAKIDLFRKKESESFL